MIFEEKIYRGRGSDKDSDEQRERNSWRIVVKELETYGGQKELRRIRVCLGFCKSQKEIRV